MSEINKRVEFLFKEVFFGTAPGADGTYFVQGGEAMFDTLDKLTAEQASVKVGPRVSSIAAHVIHTNYYLRLTIDHANSVERESDWPGSWAKQSVDEAEWQSVKSALLDDVAALLALISTRDFVANPDYLFGAMANIAHAAYHLGSIRQLFLQVSEASK